MAFRRDSEQTEIGRAFAPRTTAAHELYGEGHYAEPGGSGLDLILGLGGAIAGGIAGGPAGAAAGWQIGSATGDLVTGFVPGHEKYAKTGTEAMEVLGSSVGQAAAAVPTLVGSLPTEPATSLGTAGTAGSAISPGSLTLNPELSAPVALDPKLIDTSAAASTIPGISTASLGATTTAAPAAAATGPGFWSGETGRQALGVAGQMYQKQQDVNAQMRVAAAQEAANRIATQRLKIGGLAPARGAPRERLGWGQVYG